MSDTTNMESEKLNEVQTNEVQTNELQSKEEIIDKHMEPLHQYFDGILTTVSTFKNQLSALTQQIKCLEKNVKKEMKVLRKEASKNRSKGKRKPSGFAKPSLISDNLCDFMSKAPGSEVARTEVTQFIINYIKENKLQNPENRKIIKPDEQLKTLLDVKEDEELTYFNLQRFMNKHFHKKSVQEDETM